MSALPHFADSSRTSGEVREVPVCMARPRVARRSSKTDERVKLATRLVVEEALEGEAGDVVGREYYAHGARPGQGYRNGIRPGRMKTAEGFIEYSAPQIAGRDEPFRSAIREHLKGHTQALEDWRSRCWRAGSPCATSRMPSRTRAVGCCCRGRRSRSWGRGCGMIPSLRQ